MNLDLRTGETTDAHRKCSYGAEGTYNARHTKHMSPGFRVFFCLAVVVLMCLWARPAWSVIDPIINEFVFNHTGTDHFEYVEIQGSSITPYDGLYVLEIEGDGSVAGVVDGVFPVGTTDPSGFYSIGYLDNMIENGTVTLLLVWNFTGSQGDDLDTDNDGVLDVTPWDSIVDDVAVHDGGTSDFAYSTVTLNVGYDGIPYTPGGASRIPNGTDTDSVSDWVRNDFDGAGLPGFPGTPAIGEALNTPGGFNQLVEPAGDPIINEFVADHTGFDDHEYVEIYGDPGADYSRYRILEVEGDGTNSGIIDAILPIGTADIDGYWWTGFMDSELENGTMTLLLVENFTGYMGQDLDTDNDGVLDAMPWGRLVDDVATVNGGADDWAYSSVALTAGFDDNPYQPGGASRIPNATDTDSVSDWLRNDFEGYDLPGFPWTPDPGEAINTPGYVNQPVLDDTPPVITVELNRTVLWPPNHKMVDIHATVTVTDNLDPFPTFDLVLVSSSELKNDKGDGNTTFDIQGVGDAVPDVDFQLRAERQGGGQGREYFITYMATDASGNTSTATVAVSVPHDHSGWALASTGFAADGTAIDSSCDRFAIVLPSVEEAVQKDKRGNNVIVGGYDATQIDTRHVYLGNQKDVIRPVDSRELDLNADGASDLALFFSVSDALILQSNLSRESIGDDRISLGESRLNPGRSGESLGLHYESPDGGEYLISNILELGTPVDLVEGGALEPIGEAAKGPLEGNLPPLASIYPNPFRTGTTVSFELTAFQDVKVQVFDVRGKLVKSLKNAVLGPGRHYVGWDGRDYKGQRVSSGIYVVQLKSGGRVESGKVIILK